MVKSSEFCSKRLHGDTNRRYCVMSNVVKFVRREICEIVRYLVDKKIRLPLKLSLVRLSRPKSERPATNNVLTMLHIASKSVHFRP